jgi:hypothetical protein
LATPGVNGVKLAGTPVVSDSVELTVPPALPCFSSATVIVWLSAHEFQQVFDWVLPTGALNFRTSMPRA